MAVVTLKELLLDFRIKLHTSAGSGEICCALTKCLAEMLGADQVVLSSFCLGATKIRNFSLKNGELSDLIDPLLEIKQNKLFFGKDLLPDYLVISDVNRSINQPDLLQKLRQLECKSFAAALMQFGKQVLGQVECYFFARFHRFSREDLQALEQALSDSAFYLKQSVRPSKQSIGAAQPLSPVELQESATVESLLELPNILTKNQQPSSILLRALELFVNQTGSAAGVAAICHPQSGEFEIEAAIGVQEQQISLLEAILRDPDTKIVEQLRAAGTLLLTEERLPARSELESVLKVVAAFVLSIPLRCGTRQIGALLLWGGQEKNFDYLNPRLLDLAAFQIALALSDKNVDSCQRRIESEMIRITELLSSGVSHNFNNFLQAILGQASLIETQLAPDSKAAASARMIVEAANRAAEFVSKLSYLTPRFLGESEPLLVNNFLVANKPFFRSVLGENVELCFDLSKKELTIVADTDLLRKALANIIVNAKEAISPDSKGSVSIRSGHLAAAGSTQLPNVDVNDFVEITISNNGRSMSAEELRRCFEPFFTTKEVDLQTGVGLKWLGLGLPIAAAIIRQHGGVIFAEQGPKKESVFRLLLPCSKPGLINRTADKRKTTRKQGS